MNSIHDNQETIEKEKQEQLAREEKKTESEDATKALTMGQTETLPIIPSEEELKNAAPLFTEEEKKLMEFNSKDESRVQESEELQKLKEENDALKKFISENSLHTEAQKLKEQLESSQGTNAQDFDQQS